MDTNLSKTCGKLTFDVGELVTGTGLTGDFVGFDVLGEAVGDAVIGLGVAFVGGGVGSGTGGSTAISAWTPAAKRHIRWSTNVVFMIVAFPMPMPMPMPLHFWGRCG